MQYRGVVLFLRHKTYRITRRLSVIFVKNILEVNLELHQIVFYIEGIICVETWPQFLLESLYN